jgi:hypothetical protein
MFALRDILESLYETFNAATPERMLLIQRELREAYYELCRKTSWESMRDSIVYRYNEADDGMWLPSDVIGVDCVTDGESVWNQSGVTASLDKQSCEKKWFFAETARTPLVFGKGININSGSSEFTGAPLITANHVGMYVRIGAENAVYQLASATTLTTVYRGPTIKSGEYHVRPVTTAATIFVWRYPEQLYADDQVCVLPRADVLELATAEKMYSHSREIELLNSVQKNLYGSKGRYDGKLDMAIADNPDFVPPILPRNNAGRRAGYGARS